MLATRSFVSTMFCSGFCGFAVIVVVAGACGLACVAGGRVACPAISAGFRPVGAGSLGVASLGGITAGPDGACRTGGVASFGGITAGPDGACRVGGGTYLCDVRSG